MKATHHRNGDVSITLTEHELEVLDQIRTVAQCNLQNLKGKDDEVFTDWYKTRIEFLLELKHNIGITA